MRSRGHRPELDSLVVSTGLAVALYALAQTLTIGLGFTAFYQTALVSRSGAWFVPWYTHGVYRTRVLGPLLDRLVGAFVHVGPSSGMLATLSLVNGAAFVLTAILLRRMLSQRLWLAVVISLAFAGYVITAYDYLSYLAITVIFCLAITRRPTWQVCVAVVAGMAVRETILLVLPALALLDGRVRRSTWITAAAVAAATYMALHVGLGTPSTQGPVPLSDDLTINGWLGIAGAFGMVWATEAALRGRRCAQRGLYWALCIPFLLFVAVIGEWTEMPRTIAPVVLCSALLSAQLLRRPSPPEQASIALPALDAATPRPALVRP